MSELTKEILTYARKLLLDRGWDYRYSSGPGSRMNLRSAISAACSRFVTDNAKWHVEYMAAINTLSAFVKDGVQSWEFGTHASKPRLRTEAEVMEMLTQVIDRLERNENKARAGLGAGSDSNTV